MLVKIMILSSLNAALAQGPQAKTVRRSADLSKEEKKIFQSAKSLRMRHLDVPQDACTFHGVYRSAQTAREDTEEFGHPYELPKVKSIDGCLEMCREAKNCNFVTMDNRPEQRGICHLFKAVKIDVESDFGDFLSSPKDCAKQPDFETYSGHQYSDATDADKDVLGELVNMDMETVKNMLENKAEGPTTENKKLFRDLRDECFTRTNAKGSTHEKVFETTKEGSFNSISASIGLEASYGPVTASLETKYGTSTSDSTEIVSRRFWAEEFSHTVSINSRCLKNKAFFTNDSLAAGIAADYQKLNTKVPAFTSTESWKKYWRPVQDFMRMHGTHVITKVWFGAQITSFAYKKTTEQIDEKTFEAEACIGAGIGKVCAGTATSSATSSSSESVNEQHWNRNVVGNFAGAMGDDNVVKEFKDAVRDTPGLDLRVAKEELTPIWEILRAGTYGQFDDAATNLETYYKRLYAHNAGASGSIKYCADITDKLRVGGDRPGWKVRSTTNDNGCVCGVDTICQRDEVCMEEECDNKLNPWGCGRCLTTLMETYTAGKNCIFPFNYNGHSYDTCINGKTHYWCATDQDAADTGIHDNTTWGIVKNVADPEATCRAGPDP